MNLVIAHLGDLHLRANPADRGLLNRVKPLAAAIRGVTNCVGGFLVLVAGDVAFAGKKEEYELARDFFGFLRNELEAVSPRARVSFVIAPGNHDCDFASDTRERKRILSNPVLTNLNPDELQVLLAPQKNFLAFADQVCPGLWNGPSQLHGALPLVGLPVTVLVLNSAACSTLEEKPGTLRFPAELTEPEYPQEHFTITLLHHPLHWFSTRDRDILSRRVESLSDVVLTGHEHFSGVAWRGIDTANGSTEYLEGGILHSDDRSTETGFNVLVVDLDSHEQRFSVFRWEATEGLYLPRSSPGGLLPSLRAKRRVQEKFGLGVEFRAYLGDPGMRLTHPRKKHVTLEDVFVFPDFSEYLPSRTSERSETIRGARFLDYVRDHANVMILAGEKAGKTTLAKKIFLGLYSTGAVPLLLNGTDLRSTQLRALDELIDRKVAEQYSREHVVRFGQLPTPRRALVVDDLHLMRNAAAAGATIMETLSGRFGVVVAIAGDEFALENFASAARGVTQAHPAFRFLMPLPFGPALRRQLVRKWYFLGADLSDSDPDVFREVVDIEEKVTEALGKNLLPSLPFFLLVMLEALESPKSFDTLSGSLGHLYEAVITMSLIEHREKRAPLDVQLSWLTDLAFEFFSRGARGVAELDLSAWHSRYQSRYGLQTLRLEPLVRSTSNAGILQESGGGLTFRYPYAYYFFVARYIAKHLEEEDVATAVEGLVKRVFNEDAANILVFLCHFSANQRLLDLLIRHANEQFSDSPECSLEETLPTHQLQPPAQPILEIDDPGKHRDEYLEATGGAESDEGVLVAARGPGAQAQETRDPGGMLNDAFKTVSLLGQVLRGSVGTLPAEAKLTLAEATYSLALRTLGWLLGDIRANYSDLVENFAESIAHERDSEASADTREEAARLLFALTQMVSFVTVKHVAGAVGLELLDTTLQDTLQRRPTAARRLVDLAVRLDHFSAFPEEKVDVLAAATSRKNPLAFTLLRSLVYLHFYLFPSQRQTRQRACELLGIPAREAPFLDSRVKQLPR